MAFGGRAEQVGTPHKQVAREVLRVVRVVTRHIEAAGFKAVHHIIGRAHARGFGLIHHIERVGAQLRRAGQPAHAFGFGVVINHAQLRHFAVGIGGENFFCRHFFMPPLAGVSIEKGGAVHLARRAVPVEREGERRPAALRAQFFLAHIVAPAAAGFADAAAQHQHIDDAAVGHVHVIPVVQPRAHNHHAAAFGVVCVLGEFACHLNHLRRVYAGVGLLPSGGVGFVVIIRSGAVFIVEAAFDAVVGGHQVKHGGHKRGAAVGQGDAFGRHFAVNQFVFFGGKIREGHLHHFIVCVFQAERSFGVFALGAGFQVPFLAAVPAEAHRAVGHGEAA